MMQDAFDRALRQAHQQNSRARLDAPSVQLLRAGIQARVRPAHGLAPAEQQRARYAARTIASRWGRWVSRTSGAHDLGRLRTDWLVLARWLAVATTEERVVLLSTMAAALGLRGHETDARAIGYLLHQRADSPELFSGRTGLPGLQPLSNDELLLHAVLDLAEPGPEDRSRLNRALAKAAEAADGKARWLLAGVGAWLGPEEPNLAD